MIVMPPQRRRCFLSIVWVSLVYFASCGSILAQNSSVDTIAPIIELEELVEGVADSSQVFTVQIAEETELEDATLYHRRSGQQPYTAVPMKPIGASGFYTASIATDPTDMRPIEYYIQARDTSGNRTVSGFAFDPYSRRLAPATVVRTPAPAPITPEPSPEPVTVPSISTSTPIYKRRWFQVTLGVVAAGILASSLSDDDEDREVANVTIVLE